MCAHDKKHLTNYLRGKSPEVRKSGRPEDRKTESPEDRKTERRKDGKTESQMKFIDHNNNLKTKEHLHSAYGLNSHRPWPVFRNFRRKFLTQLINQLTTAYAKNLSEA